MFGRRFGGRAIGNAVFGGKSIRSAVFGNRSFGNAVFGGRSVGVRSIGTGTFGSPGGGSREEAALPPLPTAEEEARHRVEDSVPVGMRIAGAWSWRLLAMAAVLAVFIWLVIQLRLIVIPLMVAVLLAALLVPLSNWLQKHRWPKWLTVATAELGLIAIVTGLVLLVVGQIRRELPALQQQTLNAYQDFVAFLGRPPFSLSETEINQYVANGMQALQADSDLILSGAVSFGATAGHVAAGVLLTLFATLFLLIDGRGIWNWIVRLFPTRARAGVDGSGNAGWVTLTTFVKVQIFVAAVDAVGIGLGAWILGLVFGGFPLVIPIAIAVFLGSFIPVVGAVLTGAVAIFVALVYLGPVPALIMAGIVLLVQQVEGHVLQPLIMGTAVKVHPLAVVVAVASGGFIAGIPGALFAVPLVATVNVMIKYMASGEWRVNRHPERKDVMRHA